MGRRLNLSLSVCVRLTAALRTIHGVSVRVALSATAARWARIASPRLSYIGRYGLHVMQVVPKILDKEPKSHPKGKQY